MGAPCRVLLALAWILSGCGGGPTSAVVPEPAYAETRPAQDAFRSIQTTWTDGSPSARPGLEPKIRDFLRRFPKDGRAAMARCYLGWLEIERRRPEAARAWVAPVIAGAAGAARDFATLVEAAAFRRQGALPKALALLEPLRGKIVDPTDRGLFSEELVRALVDAKRFQEAVASMLEWAELSQGGERETVVAAIETLIRSMPKPALEAGLASLYAAETSDRRDPNDEEARTWLAVTVRERLVRIALTERDGDLARRLIETTPPRLGRDAVRDVLSDLAATSSVSARVEGRSLGVVLEVSDATVGRRSSELVSGITRALGLPSATPRPDGVQLVTRDAGDPSEVPRALSGLAGDGATLLVAGLTDETATAASLFAERTKMPVLLIKSPTGLSQRGAFTFVLGVTPSDEEAAIVAGIEREGARGVVRVGPSGTPCDLPTSVSFGPRFPVGEWKRSKIDALVLAGDPSCARDAGLEALGAGLKPLLVFGLESSEASDDLPGKKIVITAGRFPFAAHAHDADEQAYVKKWGAGPSWYGTLGHDAAVLAAPVLASLPTERVQEERAVQELHRRVRDGLSRARGKLWSTDASGFDGKSVLPRNLSTARVSWGDSR